MVDQAKFEALEASAFYDDFASARTRIPGTVAWNGGKVATVMEQPETDLALLRHGQETFNILCSNCHGRDGYGQGMIVQRGYPAPPSYHQQRLRQVPDAHIFAVIEKGMGNMPPMGPVTTAYDRWAIVAYTRALQLSQNASADDVPEDLRDALNNENHAENASKQAGGAHGH